MKERKIIFCVFGVFIFLSSVEGSLLGDATGAATGGATTGGTGGEENKDGGTETKANQNISNVTENDKENAFEEEDFDPVPSRHVRDDLLSSVDLTLTRLNQKVDAIDTTFSKRMDKMRYELMESLHKDDKEIRIKEQNIEERDEEGERLVV